jgi:putative nucleotidyltransferase with HDIG domain
MSYDYSVDRINATLSSVGNMSSNIHALQQLSRLMGDSAIGMAEISKVVMTDPVMAGRVLNAANSAYYRMLGKVDSISHALMILGIVHTRSVLLHDGLMKALKLNDAKRKDVLAAFWRHATLTATCAAHLQRLFNGMHSGNAYTAGLLHDVGKYVILAIRGEEGKLDEWLEQGKSGHEGLLQEDELFGINHAVLSANVLEKWGLPASMLKSVDYHHHPEMLEYGIADLTPEEQRQMIILYLADQVATLIDGDPNNPPAVKPIHESYLFLIDRERLWEILSSKKFMEAISMAKAITAPVA